MTPVVRDRHAYAQALVRMTLSLGDAALRAAYVAHVARKWDVHTLAGAIDVVCERAQQAEAVSREALVAIVDALNADGMADVVERLREAAAAESLLALERLVRLPLRTPRPSSWPEAAAEGSATLPASAQSKDGRMTLGRRKWLARRPNRESMQSLLTDPHPDVIRSLLRNPLVTEDDIVRLAARRPGRRRVLAELARSTKWSHRPRVRMALVMNPATPPEIAARIAGLLLRPALVQVAHSPGVAPIVRAVCLEHLERRPPVDTSRTSHIGKRLH